MHAQHFRSKMLDRQLKRYCLSVSGPKLQLQTTVMSSNKESSTHCCSVTSEVSAASSPLVSKALCMFAALSLIQKLILPTSLWAIRLLTFSYSSAVSARLKNKQKSFSSTANECVCSNCHNDRVSMFPRPRLRLEGSKSKNKTCKNGSWDQDLSLENSKSVKILQNLDSALHYYRTLELQLFNITRISAV